MKKSFIGVLLAVVTLIVLGAAVSDWQGWTADRLIYGEHATTEWTITGTILPASQCTTAWVQVGRSNLVSADTNRTLTQNAPNYFVNFLSVDTTAYTLAGDSASVILARYEMSNDTGSARAVYQFTDSTGYWIGLSDSATFCYPDRKVNRGYEQYMLGGDFVRDILYNGTGDTVSFTLTKKAYNQ